MQSVCAVARKPLVLSAFIATILFLFMALFRDSHSGVNVPRVGPGDDRKSGVGGGGSDNTVAVGDYTAVDSSSTGVQVSHVTSSNRYPVVFAEVTRLVRQRSGDNETRILSFGSSTGLEGQSLARLYFQRDHDRILGVDVDDVSLKTARLNNKFKGRVRYLRSSNAVLFENGPFDAVFAMSVLCRWPDSKDLEDISALMPFRRFSAIVADLDHIVTVGGLLVIYNANFLFTDVRSISSRYTTVPIPGHSGSGFVKKFGADNKSLGSDFQYNGVIFRKERDRTAAKEVSIASVATKVNSLSVV
jgi:hypothetical protein